MVKNNKHFNIEKFANEKTGILLNTKNTEKYLNQLWFKENVDVEHTQIWGDITRSIQNLYDSIIDISRAF